MRRRKGRCDNRRGVPKYVGAPCDAEGTKMDDAAFLGNEICNFRFPCGGPAPQIPPHLGAYTLPNPLEGLGGGTPPYPGGLAEAAAPQRS